MALLSDVVTTSWSNWPYILLFAVVARLITNRYSHGLNDVPGPFLASLSSLWLYFHFMTGGGIREVDLHKKYNSYIVRVGPRTVSVASAEASRIIYGYKPVFRKSDFYDSSSQTNRYGDAYQNLATTRDETEHAILRRPVANTYAMSSLIAYEPLIDDTFQTFVTELDKRFVDTGKECPFHKWLQMYAFDVIGELTFSRSLGFLKSGSDIGNMMLYTQRMMNYVGAMGHLPLIDSIIRRHNPIVKQFVNLPIINFTVDQIREHQKREEFRKHPDFVSQFTQAAEKYPEVMDEDRIAENARSAIAAGSDTTAVALRGLVYHALLRPRCYERLMQDIKTQLQARSSEMSPDAPFTWGEGMKMPYLQAMIKEILRFNAPLGQLLLRDVPDTGVTLCGRYFPKGIVVGSNAWVVHRDKAIFGENAEEFYPERWLECTPEAAQRMDSYSLAFGGGPRICVGKNIALLEITKTIPELFRRYEIELVDPKRWTVHSGWLTYQTGLDVRLKRRDPASWFGPNDEE